MMKMRGRSVLVALICMLLCMIPTGQAGEVGKVKLINEEDLAWVKNEASRQLSGCRVQSVNGVFLHTPDGIGHYKALWTRDFYYMVKYAGDLMSPGDVRASIEFLLKGQRADGCMPDRVNASGKAIYSPGGDNRPLADHALDNAPFMALLAGEYARTANDLVFFQNIEPQLRRGLDHVKRAENGLVYNPPESPQCPYGFTDIVAKTGHLLFSSLLYYEACQRMDELCRASNSGDAAEYAMRARLIRDNINLLWNEEVGMLMAADQDCHQIDIWGSAYAVEVGLATPEQADRISLYLIDHYDEIFQKGQVRHLPGKTTWERMFMEQEEGVYQNGAFWATPLPWVLPVLNRRDPALACDTLMKVIEDFKRFGVTECVNGEERKVPDFVVSATNLYGTCVRFHEEHP